MAAPELDRQLLAILAADIVGYSRMMEVDEPGTIARVKSLRRELAEPLVARHRGRIVKLMGDGVLVVFGSVVDAVACACALQAAVAERNLALAEAERLIFRIGVNLGDVAVDEGDVYGDGVNIAARLEQLCEPGGVAVSGTAYDQLHGKLGLPLEFAGEQAVKNIVRPIRVYRAAPPGGARAPAAEPPRPVLALPDKPSLAVLPFANMSGDPEQEYFADGITEEIITALSRIAGLFVIARNSSFVYRGKVVEIRQVGRELGVRYVLEGSVRKAGNRVRITAQLIEAATGAHLWAERYDGDLADVFELQDRVAAEVAGAIEPTLRRAEVERVRDKPTGSLDAYDLYLRALQHAFVIEAEHIQKALDYADRALAIDPDYAVAHAMKAWALGIRDIDQLAGPPAEGSAEAIVLHARRAIGPSVLDSMALALGGTALTRIGADHAAGLDACRRAVDVNPNSSLALGLGAMVHVLCGHYDQAVDWATRAMRRSPRDPLSFVMNNALAHAHLYGGRPAEALDYAAATIRAAPLFIPPYCVTVAARAELGQMEEARATAAALLVVRPSFRIAWRRRAPFLDRARNDALLTALAQAGLPE